MSPWKNSCSTPSRFAGLPAYVSLSSTATSLPAAARRRTKCEPMKPAPPVTRTRIGEGEPLSIRSSSALHPRVDQLLAPSGGVEAAPTEAEHRDRGTRRHPARDCRDGRLRGREARRLRSVALRASGRRREGRWLVVAREAVRRPPHHSGQAGRG